MSVRQKVLQKLADICASIKLDHPVRVAVDGMDAAGKTFLADELVEIIQERGREVIRGSIDGFHNSRKIRYQRGRESPEGYYLDSFNHKGLIASLLNPLGPVGSLEYRNRIFDVETDSPVDEPIKKASKDAILLFDGVFLLRPELLPYWDLKIFLDVDFVIAIERSCLRDPEFLEKPAEVLRLVCNRYMQGNKIYLQSVKPKDLADVVINNNDLRFPKLKSKNKV